MGARTGRLARAARARLVAGRVREHVVPGLGVSNDTLDRFCREVCTDSFRGVFATDTIPTVELAGRARFLIIVNLGRARRGEDGHFVAVCGYPGSIMYLDPFGRDPPEDARELRRFLYMCRRPVYCNSEQIQDRASAHCGLFAVLFVWHVDAGCPFKLRFNKSPRSLLANDDKCVEYLRKMTRVAL
jgi:hypothetical protein